MAPNNHAAHDYAERIRERLPRRLQEMREPQHPILSGLPTEWLHDRDELHHHMRGPAENVTILASAFSEEKERGSGRHEPVLWEVPFGKGRVIVCTMGHVWRGDADQLALDCAGFQTVLSHCVEYAATGKVTQSAPASFPSQTSVLNQPTNSLK